MSVKHPIVAITGSSGAGTTTVMSSFRHIFRREGIAAQIVEGHRPVPARCQRLYS